jgi:hypothetical protein
MTLDTYQLPADNTTLDHRRERNKQSPPGGVIRSQYEYQRFWFVVSTHTSVVFIISSNTSVLFVVRTHTRVLFAVITSSSILFVLSTNTAFYL